MATHQNDLEKAVAEVLIPQASSTHSQQTERDLVARIQQLWPGARKSGKELGEQLFALRELCRDKEAHFNELLQSLGIPRSTAYFYIGIFEECQLVDFEFPVNLVRFATTAGIDLANQGHRKTLLTAFRGAGSPAEPNDGTAISIVGSASTAIREAVQEANEQETPSIPLSPFQKMLVAFTVAHLETYKVLVGTKKDIRAMDETTKAAKEAEYVQSIAEMFNLDVASSTVQRRILAVGRGEQTLQDIYEAWTQLPVRNVLTREKAPIYKKGGKAS
ncbi:MAG TPA: hypothetical protein VFO34_17160 [Candidatus Acidoferrales bacterium]|nr:hypothetical protein [Candidatus Acidoferrales bacterium]